MRQASMNTVGLMSLKWIAGAVALLICVEVVPRFFGQRGAGVDPSPPNAAGQVPAFAGQTRAPERKGKVAFEV